MATLDLSGSFVDKQSYHSINTSQRLLHFFRADLLAKVVSLYQSDYVLFNMALPDWLCPFLCAEQLTQALTLSAKANLSQVAGLWFGRYATYLRDYDHGAVVLNADNSTWSRAQEMRSRRRQRDADREATVPNWTEMLAFDQENESILHRIRGMAILSNVLSFVDVDIVPRCFYDRAAWDWSRVEAREKDTFVKLIGLYANEVLVRKQGAQLQDMDAFVVRDAEQGMVDAEATYLRWRDQDKIMHHNIGQNVLWMRDITRKTLYWRFHDER